MSGGGSSKKKSGDKKDETPVPGSSPLMTQQPFMPGNDNLLAQQLAAGGYGSVPDLLAMFQQTFTPMQVLDTRQAAAPAPSTPAPTTPDPAKSPSKGHTWQRPTGPSYRLPNAGGNR